MHRLPQDILPVLAQYHGPKGTKLMASTDRKAREIQQRLELTKKELLKSIFFTVGAVLEDKVRHNKWFFSFPSTVSKSSVTVGFGIDSMSNDEIHVTMKGGDTNTWAKHFAFHEVNVNSHLDFSFSFPVTKKDQVYTFLHWLVTKYYDRLDKHTRVFRQLVQVYHHKHQLPKTECKLINITKDPVFDDMKLCLTLLMNRYSPS